MSARSDAPDADALHAVECAIDAAIARTGADARAALARDGAAHPAGIVDALAAPVGLRRALARALCEEAGVGHGALLDAATLTRLTSSELARHYVDRSPRMRIAQVAGCGEPEATVFHTTLAWDRLPRVARAIDRLYAELAAAGVDEDGATRALGAPTGQAWRARSPTLATAYARTHYGGLMPLLHGQTADLAYFLGRGLRVHDAIDRYLTAPLVHELCHFSRGRQPLEPLHLDECVGGWLCTRVHGEFAFPSPAAGNDDAIYGTPWLAQIGAAIARAFGAERVIAAHAGERDWADATTPDFAAAAARLGWGDWRARRSSHLLADTLDPLPWVALALAAACRRPLAGVSLDDLRALPLRTLELPDDPGRDRAILEDALRAMCLEGSVVDGTLRTRAAVPAGPIAIDVVACAATTRRRGIDRVDPLHWIPPAVAARLEGPVRVHLARLDAIGEAADALAAGATRVERTGFAIANVGEPGV